MGARTGAATGACYGRGALIFPESGHLRGALYPHQRADFGGETKVLPDENHCDLKDKTKKIVRHENSIPTIFVLLWGVSSFRTNFNQPSFATSIIVRVYGTVACMQVHQLFPERGHLKSTLEASVLR